MQLYFTSAYYHVGGNKLFFGGYMSGDCQREMTLQEWVERLPECHIARKEYAALKAEVEKFTSTNSANTQLFTIDQIIEVLEDSDHLDDARMHFNQLRVLPVGFQAV
jgi:hypothetical protein